MEESPTELTKRISHLTEKLTPNRRRYSAVLIEVNILLNTKQKKKKREMKWSLKLSKASK
jgi:hypothetical protein